MKRNSFIWALMFSALLATSSFAIEQDPYPFSTAADASRFYALTKEIRCVVCQNQDIADSNAPLANDLRDKVYLMVKANQSDDEIKDYLVKRYGEFILLRPRLNQLTGPLWLFPLAGLITALFFLLRFISRQRNSTLRSTSISLAENQIKDSTDRRK